MGNLTREREGSLPHLRRLSEIQVRRQTFKPISMLFNRFNINININVLPNINIRMHIRIRQGKARSLRGTLIHWGHHCPKSSNICAREVISSLWIQLHISTLSRRTGTQICIAYSTRGQGIVPMSVLD